MSDNLVIPPIEAAHENDQTPNAPVPIQQNPPIQPNPVAAAQLPVDVDGTEPAWRWDASVNLPQQAAPSPQLDLISRLTATAEMRAQAFRFCAAADVAGGMKAEFARMLAGVQTPEAVLACAGESIPALKNYIFQVFKTGTAATEGGASPEQTLERMRQFDLFWLRCERDQQSGITAPRLLMLNQSLSARGVPRPFPVTLTIARALPSCGVLTMAGYLSIPCRDLLPYDGLVWDTDNGRPMTIAKLARASARAQFAEIPEFAGRPASPDAQSRHSGDSFGTNEPRAAGGEAFNPVPSPDRRDRSRSRSPRRRRDRSRDSRDRWDNHGNELVLNATQVAESAALTQVRGIFELPKFMIFSENMQRSSQAVINAMTVHAENFLVRNHQNLARNWNPQKCKAWMLAEFRPAQTSSSSAHAKVSWFHPDCEIRSMESLWLATSIWAHLETEMRGAHMGVIMSAIQSLAIIDARKGYRLGWKSMLYILEARAMQLRHPASPDTPTNRANAAFTIRMDDDDVKLCLDTAVLGSSQSTPRAASRYDPYAPAPRARPDPRTSLRSNPPGLMVPPQFRPLENVCFEWCKAGMPQLDGTNRCPRIMAGAAKCDWDHVVPTNTPQQLVGEFIEWCQRRNPRSAMRPTGAQRRFRKRGGDE